MYNFPIFSPHNVHWQNGLTPRSVCEIMVLKGVEIIVCHVIVVFFLFTDVDIGSSFSK